MSEPDGREGPATQAAAHVTDEQLAWLFDLQRFGVRTGLEVMQELLARLGSPELEFDTVLVGGTNGKGSVARLLAACLQASGARTGLFTSPHLQRVGERARVMGVPATDAEMARAVRAVRPDAEALGATFFEVVTAACLLRFVAARVNVAVLEVGMGGRLDATNVAHPDLTIVTGVDLDHTAVLGTSVEAIAAEKAGILRRNVPLVTGAGGAALAVLKAHADAVGAPLHVLGEQFNAHDVTTAWSGTSFTLTWLGDPAHAAPLPLNEPGSLALTVPLVGRHQAANAALAAYSALYLGVPPRAVRLALASTSWPGRLERREVAGRNVVLDGAHNPQAARALAGTVRELSGGADVLVVGVSGDKDAAGLLRELAGLAPNVVFTRAVNSPRSADPEELSRLWAQAGAPGARAVRQAPSEALELALELGGAGGSVVVAGSLFLVAEVRNLLEGEEGEPYQRWQ